jgi:hypothetical protein
MLTRSARLGEKEEQIQNFDHKTRKDVAILETTSKSVFEKWSTKVEMELN